MSTTIGGVRIADMPDLGAVTDASSLVGERAGSGRFGAIALRNYIGQPTATSVKLFGAVGDGVADDTFAIQAAIDSLAAYGGGVAMPPGIYRITAGIKMRPGIVLQGNGGATIKQGNSANLSSLVDFNTYAAVNATITGIAFDGNSNNNTKSALTYIIVSGQNKTQVLNCSFVNVPGLAIYLAGQFAIVAGNSFSYVFSCGVLLQGNSAASFMGCHVINNSFYYVGNFAIYSVWSDYNVITGNSVESPSLKHQVTTAGTAVTLVSGSDFTALRAGMFMRIGGAIGSAGEYVIQSIQSPSALTLATTAGAQTNVAANTGEADLINIDSSSYNIVSENALLGGMSGGVMVCNVKGTVGVGATVVTNNTVTAVGNCGIALETDFAGMTTTIDSTIITGNTVIGCGVGGAANQPNSSNGIWLHGSGCNNTLISSNQCNGSAGGAQQWGIYVDATVTVGQTTIRGNIANGNTVGDVFGGGWLAYTPAVTANSGTFTTVSPTGRYRLIDKSVLFQATIRIVTNGTAAGTVIVGLPQPATSVAFAIYPISGRAGAISGKGLSGSIQPAGTSVAVVNVDNTYPGASGEVLAISGTYEIA